MKARSMSSLDRDTALRRLVGQLSRRGYGGSVAMTAARQALDENGSGGSGVRFR
jgi:regulatory protein